MSPDHSSRRHGAATKRQDGICRRLWPINLPSVAAMAWSPSKAGGWRTFPGRKISLGAAAEFPLEHNLMVLPRVLPDGHNRRPPRAASSLSLHTGTADQREFAVFLAPISKGREDQASLTRLSGRIPAGRGSVAARNRLRSLVRRGFETHRGPKQGRSRRVHSSLHPNRRVGGLSR